MADEEKPLAVNILRGLAGALTSLAPLATGTWRDAFSHVGHAVDFVGDLLELGLNPHEAIVELRSVLPDYRAAKARLERLIEERSK